MKKLLLSLAKPIARWLLSYAGTAAQYALDCAAGKIEDKARAETICAWIEDASYLFANFSAALSDSQVSEKEREIVAKAAQSLANRAKDLLQ